MCVQSPPQRWGPAFQIPEVEGAQVLPPTGSDPGGGVLALTP